MRWTGCIVAPVLLVGGTIAFAAAPPSLLNYQGVLRSNSDAPLSGTYDMTLRFFSASVAGDEITIDRHTTLVGAPVTVSGGLFSVTLGGGAILLDGTGPGTYTSLADVFRDYDTVYLSVQVGSETLSPRTQIVAAAYALNASNLGGRPPTAYLDTSSTAQTKSGRLSVSSSDASAGAAISASATANSLSTSGGFFENTVPFAPSYVYLGKYGAAVEAHAGYAATGNAGEFVHDFYGSRVTLADLSTAVDASGSSVGVDGTGDDYGGHFCDINPIAGFCNPGTDSESYLGYGDYGLQAFGKTIGGYFKSKTYGAETYLCNGNYGLQASALVLGGNFNDTDSGVYANAAYGPYTIYGNGSKPFVQNHPHEKDKVVVYNALEGDEAATYTRGSARLIDGEARIPLDPTFAWVTNPDIGLTVQLTPSGQWADLYVASRSTNEIVVQSRDPKESAVDFDYIVMGLRIGFEELSVVQEKSFESLIPSMADNRTRYASHPELRRFNALERFKAMRNAKDGAKALDLSASKELHDAVGEFDPATHSVASIAPPPSPRPTEDPRVPAPRTGTPFPDANRGVDPDALAYPPNAIVVDVAETVEAGDVVATDPMRPGVFVRSRSLADPGVVGIVGGALGQRWTERAPLAATGSIASCRVDASVTSIEVNDLLVGSASPGIATRAGDAPRAGTIVGKALEPLAGGMGTIRVLVMSR